jgi:hypothetical protein
MNRFTMTAAASDATPAVHEKWRSHMARNAAPQEACFRASYPSILRQRKVGLHCAYPEKGTVEVSGRTSSTQARRQFASRADIALDDGFAQPTGVAPRFVCTS